VGSGGFDLGVHLPLIDFGGQEMTAQRVRSTVEAARECDFAALSANDHFVYPSPWLDGPSALAAAAEASGRMTLATTIANVVVRGPVPVAKAAAAIDVLSGGRMVVGVGPGSSALDYDAVGIPFEERWPRFEEAAAVLRALVRGGEPPEQLRYYAMPAAPLEPPSVQEGGVPVWLASWGSDPGLRRVARLGDGWLASAYNTTPERFAAAKEKLAAELTGLGRTAEGFPNALTTMWTWVTDDAAEADGILEQSVAPMLRHDPEELRGNLCIGSPLECAELLSKYAANGCDRVFLWPLGDERRQLERIAAEVMPNIE
jgi:alkanesulfonate monooxygenase SsuD/methylene tetrahydromethanopterin reductase-like flavin-dependent oxidoreductase (luciferase family)